MKKIPKPIDYEKIINRATHSFTYNPLDFSQKLGLKLIESDYTDQRKRKAIASALAFWQTLDFDSAFYKKMADTRNPNKRKWQSFDHKDFDEVVKETVEIRQSFLKPTESKVEKYTQVICLLFLLPDEVVRKWLYHYNVDFQSRESFLRRLTDEQSASLVNHWELLQQGCEVKNLPCFSEGMANKLWKLLGVSYTFAAKFSPKSALAYDFFGGIGYQKYPSIKTDEQDDGKIIKKFFKGRSFWQVISDYFVKPKTALKTEKDMLESGFEVNQECGWYWVLYKTMFSNRYYRTDKEVQLGRKICPGVYATFIFWSTLLFISPISLMSGLALGHYLNSAWAIPFLSIGMITPSVLVSILFAELGYAILRFVEKKFPVIKQYVTKVVDLYDKDYVEHLQVTVGFVFAAFVLCGLTILVYWAGSFWAIFWFIFGFLAITPYCLKHETLKFWQTPLVGKIVPISFILSLTWDYISLDKIIFYIGYVFSQIWLEIWKIIFNTIILIYDNSIFLAASIIFLWGFGLIYAYSYILFKKYDELMKDNPKVAKIMTSALEKLIVIGLPIVALLYMYRISTILDLSDVIIVTSFLIAFIFIMRYIIRKLDVSNYVFDELLAKEIDSLRESSVEIDDKVLHSNLLAASFYLDRNNSDVITSILDKTKSKWYQLRKWAIHAISKANNSDELKNIEKFVDSYTDSISDSYLGYIIYDEAVNLLLAGKLNKDSFHKLESELFRRKREQYEKWQKLQEIPGKIKTFISGLWLVEIIVAVFTVIKNSLKGIFLYIVGLFVLFYGFYRDRCPLSPSKKIGDIK
ncbi:MAG: hypothetical protein R3B60_01755 [Candidatus Paceibacterota bacterium]